MARPGQPTLLTPELIERARKYIEDFADDGYSVIPTAAGMALYLGVSKQAIHLWAANGGEFLEPYSKMLQVQEAMTLGKALTSEFNSNISKLILANHGYSDRQAVDVTTNGKDIAPTFGSLYGTPDGDAES